MNLDEIDKETKEALAKEGITIKGFIGKGGFGLIMDVDYEYESKTTNLAVKRVSWSDNLQENQELLNEIKINMHFPKNNTLFKKHVLGFHKAFAIGKYVYLLLDKGQFSLQEIIENDDQFLTSEQFYCLSEQIVQGLFLIHSLGIAHNDIKNVNLLVSSDNDVLFMDFGRSVIFDEVDPNNYFYEYFHTFDNRNLIITLVDLCFYLNSWKTR